MLNYVYTHNLCFHFFLKCSLYYHKMCGCINVYRCPQYIELGSVGSLNTNDCKDQSSLRESSLSRGIVSRPPSKRENITKKTSYIFQLVAHERRLSTSASRTMAAMSLGFIVMVTPWTIQEVVAACTGSKPPPFLDFLATWLALSNSFWNPFLYWLLNNHFRRISRELLYTKVST